MGPASYANLQPSWAIQALLKARPSLGSPLLQGEAGCLNTRIDDGSPENTSLGEGIQNLAENGQFPLIRHILDDTGLLA